MPSRGDSATCGWRRRVFHYPPPTLMSRNFRLPCTIELQPLSLTLLKMRKVELKPQAGIEYEPSYLDIKISVVWEPLPIIAASFGCKVATVRSPSLALQVPQRRTRGFAASVAADHTTALFPAALAFDLVGGSAVLGHATGHARPPAAVLPAGGELQYELRPSPAEGSGTPTARILSRCWPRPPTGGRPRPAWRGESATTDPWASTLVLERTTVMRPLPSSQRTTSPR